MNTITQKPSIRRILLFVWIGIILYPAFAVCGQDDASVLLELIDFTEISGQLISFTKQPGTANSHSAFNPFVSIGNSERINDVPIAKIGRIHFGNSRTISIVSNAQARCFELDARLPDYDQYAGWNQSKDFPTEQWQRIHYPKCHFKWAYIPRAAWIWNDPSWFKSAGKTVLFRQDFTIPNDRTISTGYLTLAADDAVDELYVNGRSISAKHTSSSSPSMWDISYLLKNGENFIAVKVTNKGKVKLDPAGVSYRIDITLVPNDNQKTKRLPPGAIAFLLNEDLVRGELTHIGADTITLDTPYSKIVIDRDWIRKLLLNYDTVYQAEKRSRLRVKNLFRQKSSLFSPPLHREKIWQLPVEQYTRTGLRLRNGDFIEGKALKIKRHAISFKPMYGDPFSLPLHSIDAVFFNKIDKPMYSEYPQHLRSSVIKVTLTNGDTISGVLRDITSAGIDIALPHSYPITIAARHIISVNFEFSLIEMLSKETKQAIRSSGISPKIAIIGESTYDKDTFGNSPLFQTTRIIAEMGIDWQYLTPQELINKTSFNQVNFPILLNIDEKQQFWHTIREDGDGLKALIDYGAKKGGTVISIGHGHPFYYGLRSQSRRKIVGKEVCAQLGLNIKTLGEVSPGVRPFQRPSNKNQELFFVKNSEIEYTKYLPAKVEFPQIRDTDFKPIVEPEDERFSFYPMYYLQDSHGKSYGTAMAVVKYKAQNNNDAYAIYISHLLANAKHNNQSMIRYLLPTVLNITLAKK